LMKKCVLMIYPRWLTAVILILLVTTVANAAPPPVSGRVVNGFRMLTLESADIPVHLTVYRGDYVQFIVNQGGETPLIRIPELGIETRPGSDPTSVPYFKMKRSGRFVLLVDRTEGLIEVVDYRQLNYRELTASDASDMIQRQDPLILDVRTDLEYKNGHLKDAMLIPVQELQRRVGELDTYREREILVYCATGNRSTVASKILIDHGYENVFNLRHGIVDWWHRKLPKKIRSAPWISMNR